MKISMLPSVNVIYLRMDQKLIPLIINKRREIMYWDGSGQISMLKNNFLQESLLLQPMMILIIFFCKIKIFILSDECPKNKNKDKHIIPNYKCNKPMKTRNITGHNLRPAHTKSSLLKPVQVIYI